MSQPQPPTAGPIVLAGSGEFLPVMADLDRSLLDGRPQRVAVVPTAAGLEGEERIAYWVDLARRHYGALQAEVIPVVARNRDEAADPALASAIEGCGLVYLSGGNPGHLLASIRGTALWAAIETSWRSGAALCGCSAGAIALCGRFAGFRAPTAPEPGLEVVPGVAVLPHFDRVRRWRADVAERVAESLGPDVVAIGIDEDTAMHGSPAEWTVYGNGGAWILSGPEAGTTYKAGARFATG